MEEWSHSGCFSTDDVILQSALRPTPAVSGRRIAFLATLTRTHVLKPIPVFLDGRNICLQVFVVTGVVS